MNRAAPGPIAVIVPLSLTVATDSFVLVHVPPFDGVIDVVSPTQRLVSSIPLITGVPNTLIDIVLSDVHPLDNSTKVNEAIPSVFPVTIPELFTDAILSSLLIHIPPLVGDNEVVLSIHISAGPNNSIVGLVTMVIGVASSPVHPELDTNNIVA